MGTTLIQTDVGPAYIKALGNRQGPHALACEFVGSSLARWFNLRVPDFAIMNLPAEACFDLPRGHRCKPGPAFVSRHVRGGTWQGSLQELRSLVNPGDITRLVIFDTWVSNCDRHPPDLTQRRPNYNNVYLGDTEDPLQSCLYAIDHTHCFDCGRDLTPRLSHIDLVQDDRTYGLFPGFRPLLDPGEAQWCMAMLRSVQRRVVEEIVDQLPPEWEAPTAAAAALVEFLHRRARYVADRIDAGWPQAAPGARGAGQEQP